MTEQEFIAEAKRQGKGREETLAKFKELKAQGYFDQQPAPEPTPAPQPEPEAAPAPPPSMWERVQGGWERTQDTAADLLAGAAEGVADTTDFITGGGIAGYTPPLDPIAALRKQMGVSEEASVQDLLAPELQPRNMQFSENPNVSTAVKAIGGLGGAGLASLPTAGARMTGKAVGAAEEVVEGTVGLGVGLKPAIEAAAAPATKLTGLAVPKEQADFTDYNWVQDAVDEINVETAAAATRPYMNDYQQLDDNYRTAMEKAEELAPDKKLKAQEKAAKRREEALAALENKVGMADLKHAHSFQDEHVNGVIQSFARMYDLPVAEAAGIVYRSGGVNTPQSFEEMALMHNKSLRQSLFESTIDRRNAERTARGLKNNKQTPTIEGYERWIRPAIGILRDTVGAGMANRVEAGMVEGMAQRDVLIQKYTSMQTSVTEVATWADNPAIKRQFMDLHNTGVEGRAALIADARQNLSSDSFRAFMDMIDDTYANQKNVQKHLLRADQPRDATHWGINKLPERLDPSSPEGVAARRQAQRAERNTVAPLAQRSRKSAAKMTDEELAQYDNPIWSNLGQLFDAQDMIALAKSLDIPPSMAIDDGLDKFSDYVRRHVRTVTGDDAKSKAAETVMHSVVVGSRTQTSDWQRAFMNQAYGQTLGHVKSALLQTHDHFITAMRVGPKETLQSLFSDGVKAQDFGLSTNAFNTREFREGLDAGFMDKMRGEETTAGKVARGSEAYANVSFKTSGFQGMDRWTKGANLRATHRNMENLVNDPEAFTQRYGDFFSRSELAEVRNALTKKTPFHEMSKRQQDIMGRALVSHLGQQQLIGAASRPLAYLDARQGMEADLVRPLFAMRGFAIVQADLFKTMVIDRAKAGDMKGAGQAMGKYLAYVGAGYVIADTFRDVVSSTIEGGMADVMTDGYGRPIDKANIPANVKPELYPEKMMERAYESVMGPMSFNTVGDPYTLSRGVGDGFTETLANSFVPPLGAFGVAGDAASAAVRDIQKGNATTSTVARAAMTELSKLVPGVGREIAGAMKLQEKYDIDMQTDADIRGMYVDEKAQLDKLRDEIRELER